MPDLSSVAREAARAEVAQLHVTHPGSPCEDIETAAYVAGAAWCASRLPSEEELAEAMFVAYADETGKPWAEEGHGIRSLYLEQARAVLSLIGEKLSG